MKPVIQVSGKAKQVFKYVEALKRYKGSTTLRDLAKENKTVKIDLRTE